MLSGEIYELTSWGDFIAGCSKCPYKRAWERGEEEGGGGDGAGGGAWGRGRWAKPPSDSEELLKALRVWQEIHVVKRE